MQLLHLADAAWRPDLLWSTVQVGLAVLYASLQCLPADVCSQCDAMDALDSVMKCAFSALNSETEIKEAAVSAAGTLWTVAMLCFQVAPEVLAGTFARGLFSARLGGCTVQLPFITAAGEHQSSVHAHTIDAVRRKQRWTACMPVLVICIVSNIRIGFTHRMPWCTANTATQDTADFVGQFVEKATSWSSHSDFLHALIICDDTSPVLHVNVIMVQMNSFEQDLNAMTPIGLARVMRALAACMPTSALCASLQCLPDSQQPPQIGAPGEVTEWSFLVDGLLAESLVMVEVSASLGGHVTYNAVAAAAACMDRMVKLWHAFSMVDGETVRFLSLAQNLCVPVYTVGWP
jgi:hypothetical protein